MRRAVSLLLAAILVGCTAEHIAYHSTADLPYYTTSTETNMELIGAEEAGADAPYAVFVAADDASDPYVIIAPLPESGSEYSFSDANFRRSVPLSPPQVDSLVTGLSVTLENWGSSEDSNRGRFYEFVHVPQNEVRQASKDVVEFYPALRFTASDIPEGSTARLVLGGSAEQTLVYSAELPEREDVATLRQILRDAQQAIDTDRWQ